MFKAFASKRTAHAVEKEILSRPNAPLYHRAGLYLALEDSTFSKREEAYMTTFLDKLSEKVRWDPVSGSARAYTTFLNKLRADTFDMMVEGMAKNGEATLEEARTVANYINVATGRGSLGHFEQAAIPINTIFFAPRYVTSRFQLLFAPFFGLTTYGHETRARKAIAKEYAKYLMGIGTFYALAIAALSMDDDEETGVTFDPRSSDFGKIRLGNTRIDPLSGLSQTTVILAKTATGQKKNASGEVVSLRGEGQGYGQGVAREWGKFIRYKFSPHLGAAVNLANKKPHHEPLTPTSS